MKEIILLTKILLKNSFNLKNNKKNIGRVILLLIGYAYIIGIISFFSNTSIKSLMEIQQEAVFINIVLIAMLGISIVQTIFTSLNVLYFSKDIEYLLPLPIHPRKIIMSKINCLLVSEYIMNFIIILPAFIIYGLLLNVSIRYYLIILVMIFVFPILPVTLVVFIITFIINFTKIIRNKDIVQYITVAITMLFILGVQLLFGSNENITNEQLANMLMKTNGLTEIYSKYFITIKPTMNAILNFDNINGLKNLFVVLFETILFYIIAVNFSSKLYIKSATNMNSGGVSKKNYFYKEKEIKLKKVGISYVKKEFKNLIRNPIFFMQCVLPPILFPLIFSIPIFMNMKNIDLESTKELITTFENMNSTDCFIVLIIIIQLLFLFNFISVTAISRDGENARFMKYIPIRLYKQCIYKIIPSIILNTVPILYVVFAGYILLPNLNLLNAVYILAVSTLINFLFSYLMILIDLKRPKLIWTSEYSVVKQNINMLYEMIIGIFCVTILFLFGCSIKKITYLASCLFILNLIAILILNKYVKKNEKKLFKNIN